MIAAALIVTAAAIVWIATGTLNYVLASRAKMDNQYTRDLLVCCGPVGTLMLLLMASMTGFLELCAILGSLVTPEKGRKRKK